MRWRRIVCAIGVGIGLLAVPPAAFYGLAEITAKEVVRSQGIDVRHSNAVKHSLAASYLYSGLRLLGLPPDLSQSIVLQCGSLNEFAELYVKRGRADSTAEIARDLRNNLIGVMVARWIEMGRQVSHASAIARLASGGVFDAPPPSDHAPAGREGYRRAAVQEEADAAATAAAVIAALEFDGKKDSGG